MAAQFKRPEKKIDYEKMSKEEGFKCFKKLLTDLGVTATWRWEDAHRIVQNEERAKCLKTVHDRKQAFNEFINEYRQREKQESKQKRTQVCLIFNFVVKRAVYTNVRRGKNSHFSVQIF